jgi:hypothetical protein
VVSETADQGADDGPQLVLTFEELAEAVRHAPPPTEDDVPVFWDGRVVNTKERLLAILKGVEANERAGVTLEDIERWQGGVPGCARVNWDWDPAEDA